MITKFWNITFTAIRAIGIAYWQLFLQANASVPMCTCNTFGCNANDDCDYCSKIAQLNTINHILKYSSLQRQNVMIVEMMINVPMKKIMDNLELVLLDQCVIILQDVSFVNCIQVLEYIFVIWIHFSFRKVWWWKVYFERLYDATNQNQWLSRH